MLNSGDKFSISLNMETLLWYLVLLLLLLVFSRFPAPCGSVSCFSESHKYINP